MRETIGGTNIHKKLKSSLIISISQNEKILKFNEECEKVTGYKKDEVLNKNISELLIPERYFEQWKNFLNLSRVNKLVDDYKIPILTKNGHEIMVSWSNFPVRMSAGMIGDIGFVGKIVTDWIDDNESILLASNAIPQNIAYENKNIENLKEIIKDLEGRNKELQQENKKLENHMVKLGNKKRKTDEDGNPILEKSLYSFSEMFGGKKRKEEYERTMHDLDEHANQLKEAEEKINKEKMDLKEQIKFFIEWRERLELIENEIENRRIALEKQEIMLAENMSNIEKDTRIEDEAIKEFSELFEKITECATVIQRGIVKHVNEAFVNLIGYSSDELIEKSFFDFIGPEGLSDIEKYYLNRLKGEDTPFYKTVLLTKDNNKITVEVSSKPTFFNGEKAELNIIKKID